MYDRQNCQLRSVLEELQASTSTHDIESVKDEAAGQDQNDVVGDEQRR